jgi:DNA repair protein RadC
VKEVAVDDRPREKLVRHGVAALGDNELVAVILGSGCQRLNALAVANELLATHGGLHGLVRATCDDLSRITGIGRVKAAQLIAALELGRRTLARAPSARRPLRTPDEAAAYLLPLFGSRPIEQLGIILLDSKHRVLRIAVLAIGGLNTTSVEPRDVFREAAIGNAAAVVIFHNHPSGDPSPSPDDLELTRRLVAAGFVMGIEVVDHIILGDVRYWSMKLAGQL